MIRSLRSLFSRIRFFFGLFPDPPKEFKPKRRKQEYRHYARDYWDEDDFEEYRKDVLSRRLK